MHDSHVGQAGSEKGHLESFRVRVEQVVIPGRQHGQASQTGLPQNPAVIELPGRQDALREEVTRERRHLHFSAGQDAEGVQMPGLEIRKHKLRSLLLVPIALAPKNVEFRKDGGGTRSMALARVDCSKKVRMSGSSRPRPIRTLVSSDSSLFMALAINDVQSGLCMFPHLGFGEFVTNLAGLAPGENSEAGGSNWIVMGFFAIGRCEILVLFHNGDLLEYSSGAVSRQI